MGLNLNIRCSCVATTFVRWCDRIDGVDEEMTQPGCSAAPHLEDAAVEGAKQAPHLQRPPRLPSIGTSM